MTRLARAGIAGLALVVAATLLAAGCGVPLDSSPRAITRTTLAPGNDTGRETPTTSASPGARRVSAYFIRGEALEQQQFPVDGVPTLSDALSFVFADPPEGLTTSIPSGTRLLSAKVVGHVATIDLTSEINDISGQAQKQAYAQVVFTAFTFLNDPATAPRPEVTVNEVRFLVDGKPVDAPTDNGNRASVTAYDYKGPLNPPDS